jgi:DNA-binding Xre family transcriptional regulator
MAQWKKLKVSTLNEFIESKRGEISKKEIARRINMSENGLQKAIKQESLRLTTFQELCIVTDTHPCYFFSPEYLEDSPKKISLGNELENCQKEYVPRVLYDEMTEQLKSEIAYLRELNLRLADGGQKGNSRCG